MSFYWPSCSFSFCLLWFSLSLLSFYGLGSSDRYGVNRSLPGLHYQPFLIIIIIINKKAQHRHAAGWWSCLEGAN